MFEITISNNPFIFNRNIESSDISCSIDEIRKMRDYIKKSEYKLLPGKYGIVYPAARKHTVLSLQTAILQEFKSSTLTKDEYTENWLISIPMDDECECIFVAGNNGQELYAIVNVPTMDIFYSKSFQKEYRNIDCFLDKVCVKLNLFAKED